ncbi:hypothetical protein J0A68_20840 [Algoriphagus sp. H41]|uniref:Transporter n=1 Tax=Algoriphagus oliviformis TaxID=2811231 RepID=A0ABS3CB73_9BACT|nr:hypothetical protein [Algoriphagus oliviformis]MBN7813415.1 hypothetical protein [Algoriphagus oliviformis]
MEVLIELFQNLLPVLAFIGVGWFLRKRLGINPALVSTPLVFVLIPVLVVYNVSEADSSKIALIPVLSFMVSLAMNLPALLAKKTLAKREDTNLLKSSFTFFNVLFFGLPVVSALFGKEATSILICVYLGTAVYGDIIGFFQVAKTKLSTKEAVKEILKVPFIYVFIVAIAIKIWGLEIPDSFSPVMDVVGWVVSALGMMIVGVHLDQVDFKNTKIAYFGKLLGFRMLSAALFTFLVIGGEYLLWESLDMEDYLILALLPFLPVASNISLFASFLETEEECFSLVVFFSILLSLAVVPVVAQFIPSPS